MRFVASALIFLLLAYPVAAAPAAGSSADTTVFKWIEAYREKPRPAAVPSLVKKMSQYGAFNDPDASGFYVGFIAGVLGANPKSAAKLARSMLPLPPQDDWVVVRAVAYSGLPDWRYALAHLRGRLPARQAMIDKYIAGELPTLVEVTEVPPPPPRGLKALFRRKKEEANPLPLTDHLDALWGYYLATGSPDPIHRIVAFLPLSEETDFVDRLTLGGAAKYMLASAAVRDADLLRILRDAEAAQDEQTKKVLADVIDAAEGVDAGHIRAEQLAAIEELKLKGPGSKRKVAWWGRLGEFAIAGGCVAAAATGQVQLGIPCVVGGALSSAALRYWASRE